MFNDKRRGDVYWMTDTPLREGDTHILRGDRPAVIVSSDEVNQTSPTVTVIPLTTSAAKLEQRSPDEPESAQRCRDPAGPHHRRGRPSAVLGAPA